jgi:DNA invertase Pin-like site-specific DNA recombinase
VKRQREGIAVAKATESYGGRPLRIRPGDVQALAATMGPSAIAEKLGSARSRVYRLLGERPERPACNQQPQERT